MEQLTLFKPGTIVHAGGTAAVRNGDINEVKVDSVTISRDMRVTYEVSYWKNGNRTELTVPGNEIFPLHRQSQSMKIGFKVD